MHPDQLTAVVVLEGRRTGGALVEHHPEGVQVGAPVQRPLDHAGLLRSAVQQGPGHLSPHPLRAGPGGEAEVDQFDAVIVVNEDVVRLDVSVHHPAAVDLPQREGDAATHCHDGGF